MDSTGKNIEQLKRAAVQERRDVLRLFVNRAEQVGKNPPDLVEKHSMPAAALGRTAAKAREILRAEYLPHQFRRDVQRKGVAAAQQGVQGKWIDYNEIILLQRKHAVFQREIRGAVEQVHDY